MSREGQQAKENLGWGKEGELRTPLQASQQVWTVLQLVPGCDQSACRRASPWSRNTAIRVLSCRDAHVAVHELSFCE